MPGKLDSAVAAHPKAFFAPAPHWAGAALVVPFLILSLVLQLPGNVPYDGITVWYEAETGRLYAQHPAALVLVWHLADALVRGPALFTALQLGSLWTAAGVLVARTRPPLWLAGCFYFFLLAYPPLFAMSAVTVKDAFGGHLALLGFVLAMPSQGRPHALGTWLAAFACAMLATLFRYQLGLMLPVLAVLLWWEARRHPRFWWRSAAGAVAGSLATYGLATFAVMALFTQTGTGDVGLSVRKMMIFDIAGVVANNPAAKLPVIAHAGVDVPKLKAEIHRTYKPLRVDTLWQVDGTGDSVIAPHGVFLRMRSVSNDTVLKQWLSSSRTDPGPLLRHRVSAFARVLGFGPIYECRPVLAGISWLPKAPAAYVMSQRYRTPVSAMVMQSRIFPVGPLSRSWLYAVICLSLVGAALFGSGVPREAVLLSGFALLYEASYFFLPQACEVRYSYPEMLGAIFSLAILIFTTRSSLSE